jgi:hypothetical protein
LREFLFKTLEDYQSKRIDKDDAVVATKIVNSIIATVNADLSAAKIMHEIKAEYGNEIELNLSLTDKESQVTAIPDQSASYVHKMGQRRA